MKIVSSWSGLPYTSLITAIGFCLGVLEEKYSLGRIGDAIEVYSNFPPHMFLLVFLPALIFESAFNSDWHIFKVELGKIIILAGPMLLVSTFLSACMMRYMFGYDGAFTWEAALMYGAIISATDPVAVVALLRDLGASRRLATLIEGESLLNDGTAMVAFLILLSIVEGEQATTSIVLLKFLRLTGGGVLLGLLGGVFMSFLLNHVQDPVLEINFTLVVTYILFYIAEDTSVHVSGIIAMVVMGLYMTNIGKTRIS